MNFKEAIETAVSNKITTGKEPCLLGVAYIPNSSDGEFQVVDISLNDDEKEQWIDVIIEGGDIGSICGTEGTYGGETFEAVVENITKSYEGDAILTMLNSLNYRVFNFNSPMGVDSEQALYEIFPSLPAPYSCGSPLNGKDLVNFKDKAVDLVSAINSEK